MGDDHYHSARHGVERVDVPGGWIYFGEPLGSPVLVSDPSQWTHDPRMDHALELLRALNDKQEKLMTTAAEVQTALDSLSTKEDVALALMQAEKTSIDELKAQIAALPPDPALDGLMATVNRMSGNVDAAMAVVQPPPPAPVP